MCVSAYGCTHVDTPAHTLDCAVGPEDRAIALNHSSLEVFCFLSAGSTAAREKQNQAVGVQLLAWNHVVLPGCPSLAVT